MNQNPRVSEIYREITSSTVSEGTPEKISSVIQPVIDLTPGVSRLTNLVRGASASNATSATVHTCSTERDTYVTACYLWVSKDASSPSNVSTLRAVINGQTQVLIAIPGIALTAQNGGFGLKFMHPIKIDRGSQVLVTNGSATSVIKTDGYIYGYEL